jgi:hypothetical protein
VSLRGYIKKGKPAPWTRAFPSQVTAPKPRETHGAEARDFVKAEIAAGKTCPVVAAVPELRGGFRYGHRISAKLNEVHHVYGRRGRLLRWQPGWKAVSKQGHRWVHEHVAEAVARGWIGPPGTWNDYERARKHAETLDNKG